MSFGAHNKINLFLKIFHIDSRALGVRSIFLSDFFFIENLGFVRFSSKYIKISCLQHKTGDKCCVCIEFGSRISHFCK